TGFARTEVLQTFHNPNDVDLEAIYSFPLPKSASLSEVTITAGEKEIHGEVLPRDEADRIYEEERDQGNDAGLASKNGYQTFEFRVTPVRRHRDPLRLLPAPRDRHGGRSLRLSPGGRRDGRCRRLLLDLERQGGGDLLGLPRGEVGLARRGCAGPRLRGRGYHRSPR
ncbi:MAG: VIT domain-containing protein, partial [Planctomycetota bacterium]